jgi:hypothetical protein
MDFAVGLAIEREHFGAVLLFRVLLGGGELSLVESVAQLRNEKSDLERLCLGYGRRNECKGHSDD